jgi:hypothetical protein
MKKQEDANEHGFSTCISTKKKRKNSSNTCFFRKRDCPASWVADAIWQQHLEESKVPNPNFSKF